MSEQTYLEPGFDPTSITMPKLRSILVEHGVNYPSTAKKGQLVEIFNEHVLPQARAIRSANARVKRTSMGIENVPASQDTADEDDEEMVAAPLPSAIRSARRSTRARTEEAQEIVPTPRAARHSTAPPQSIPRTASSKHARPVDAPDTERGVKRAASRGSRLSAAAPSMREQKDDGAGASPFSSDNVFQAGSSPPAPRSRDPDRRRTTMTTSRDAERRRSRDTRRRTEEVRPVREQLDGAVVPSRKTFEMPITRVKRQEVQPSEEFTPEEEQDLAIVQQSGELVPARSMARRPASHAARTAPWAVLVIMMSAMAGLWRQEKLDVGYCGIGSPSTEVAGVQVPDWADVLRPQCEPCPPHAFCSEKLDLVCDPDFVRTPHPLSFGGLVPLPPSCEPDSAKARKVNAVAERAVEELREQRAKYECGDATAAEVKETQLKKAISTKRRKGMTNEEFEDLWSSALGEVQNADEVIHGADASGHFVLQSTSLARLPLLCAVRRSLRQTLRQYVWPLVATILVLSGGGYGRYTITSGRQTEEKAKQLAGLAMEKLREQAALHAYDPGAYREDYLPMAQLRDDVLRNEFSATRRKKLWERVQKKVESNSNVRPMVREGRSGDVGRMWEWVGAVGMIESPPGSGYADRRRSGGPRVSFGGERLIEPRDDSETDGVQKWQEGGQYY